MSLDCLAFDIEYTISADKYLVSGGVSSEGQESIIETFLRSQLGAGKDTTRARELDVYHIGFEWYPENDTIIVSSDTGNKGLRDGILYRFLSFLNDGGSIGKIDVAYF